MEKDDRTCKAPQVVETAQAVSGPVLSQPDRSALRLPKHWLLQAGHPGGMPNPAAPPIDRKIARQHEHVTATEGKVQVGSPAPPVRRAEAELAG